MKNYIQPGHAITLAAPYDVVWGIFTANPAMADGTTLFHASHKNLAGAGAALDVAGLAKARTA